MKLIPLVLSFPETSHVGQTAGGGGRQDPATREGDEPGDQGPHRGAADRERPPHAGSRHPQGDDKGEKSNPKMTAVSVSRFVKRFLLYFEMRCFFCVPHVPIRSRCFVSKRSFRSVRRPTNLIQCPQESINMQQTGMVPHM